MNILIYGGSFNPPHKGHLNAARNAVAELKPDKLLVIPDCQPPHKTMSEDAPTPEQRMELCRIAFAEVPKAEVSDIEILRGGKSYTSDTLRALRERWPEARFTMLVGADMLRTIDAWHDADYILRTAAIAAVSRNRGEQASLRLKASALRHSHGAEVRLIAARPLPASSTELRSALGTRGGLRMVPEREYAFIVKHRLYGVKINFRWLRKQGYAMLKPTRIPHVRGCEEEARKLAARWGADPDQAAEAASLHDCTKKEDLAGQLRLCEKYGIIPDEMERVSGKLLHSKTGAAIAEREFGLTPEAVSAICWHTTGKADMTLLEKIIYMADYIEPNRDFEGVEPLRALAYQDLDAAMLLGLEMSRDEIRARGERPHVNTLDAIRWLRENRNERESL